MKLYDGGKILVGLLVFLIFITFPIWYNVARGTATYKPDPKIITDAKQCVDETSYMKEFHMYKLNDWRTEVVRKNERYFTAPDGNRYEMSLSKTCMKCHSNKSEFCDTCHNYVGVNPYCWDCHVEPKEVN